MAEITLGEILKKASIRVPILVDKIFKKNNRNNIFELVSNGANFTATAANLDNIIYGPGKENAVKFKQALDALGRSSKGHRLSLINGGKELSSGKFKKTAEFGGGKGSGGGASNTALAESAACIATAWLLQTGNDLTIGDFNTKSKATALIKKLDALVDIGKLDTKVGMQQVLDFLADDPEWLDTSVRTAKTLKRELKLKKAHHYHRDSAFMNNIYKQASSHLKKLNDIGIRIGGDKWNPGDIWIAEGSGNKGFSATKDLAELNKEVLVNFKDAEIMGVSLKKLPKKGAATFSVYNLENENRIYKFKGVKKITPTKLMESKDMYIDTFRAQIQIRTFDTNSNIQCEIKGGAAAGGKAGFGVTEYAIEHITNHDLLEYPEINKFSEEDKIKHIQKYYKAIFKSNVTEKEIMDTLDTKKNKQSKFFNEWSIPAQNDYWSSKIQALQIASIINNSPQQDDLVTIIFAYAASLGLTNIFEASVYAKVY